MKIEYLYINGYKNLQNIEMFLEQGSSVNSIIGNNGSGKSNILEAITIIFASTLTNTNSVEFEFCIKYAIEESKIQISNISGKLDILKNSKKVSLKDIKAIMPKVIFLYYAGETKRLKQLSDASVDDRFKKILKKDEDIALKFLTYISVEDFGTNLLVDYIYGNRAYENICKLIDIQGICSPITINLHKPNWSKSGKAENFWNAIGTVAKELNSFTQKGNYIIIDNSNSKIIIDDIYELKDEEIGAIGLFTILKVLSQADILESIEYDIIKGDSRFNYMDLSEGEKQLCQLLSILEITREYKSIFLLDEFDSYLHPNWQRKFVDIINGIEIRGQVLFTTHSPLTLGKMKKENILLLKEGIVYNPSSETYNRDITEVLEELMDVKKRPIEVEEMIMQFRESVLQKNKAVSQLIVDIS